MARSFLPVPTGYTGMAKERETSLLALAVGCENPVEAERNCGLTSFVPPVRPFALAIQGEEWWSGHVCVRTCGCRQESAVVPKLWVVRSPAFVIPFGIDLHGRQPADPMSCFCSNPLCPNLDHSRCPNLPFRSPVQPLWTPPSATAPPPSLAANPILPPGALSSPSSSMDSTPPTHSTSKRFVLNMDWTLTLWDSNKETEEVTSSASVEIAGSVSDPILATTGSSSTPLDFERPESDVMLLERLEMYLDSRLDQIREDLTSLD